jgi:glycerophosphoryl diester phosphodiesterase
MGCYSAWNGVVVLLVLSFWLNPMVHVLAEESDRPIVIAHRGASGYLVEHTEGAKVLAHAQGSDYIEQDVVLSKDRQFVVTHDITMEETTDVEDVYPDRARSDGKWYFADFDWQELQALSMHERTRRDSRTKVFPDRFPGRCGQRLMRLEDEIQLLRGLDRTTGRQTGFYIELKSPSFHEREFGEPMGRRLVEQLATWGIRDGSDRCFIQCFEWDELERLGTELHCQLPLVYLLGRPIEREALEKASKLCYGIGPSLDLLADRGPEGQIQSSGLVESAHALGLRVHPYTVRRENSPKWSSSTEETHRTLLEVLRVDGFFTDFPDLGRQAVDQRHP